MSETVLALDVGTRRIGVAVSDDRGSMALPLETVDAVPRGEAVDRIVKLVGDYQVGDVVVGWPVDMQGREGRAVGRVRAIVEPLEKRLEAAGHDEVEVHRWDERLTTTEANRLLDDVDVTRRRRKQAVDQVAACKILEGFLARRRGEGNTP